MFIGIHVCLWSNVIFYLFDVGFFIGLCNPRRKTWQPWVSGQCFIVEGWNIATGIFNSVSDIVILILPIPCVWRLQMPLRKKAMTIGIFATGFL